MNSCSWWKNVANSTTSRSAPQLKKTCLFLHNSSNIVQFLVNFLASPSNHFRVSKIIIASLLHLLPKEEEQKRTKEVAKHKQGISFRTQTAALFACGPTKRPIPKTQNGLFAKWYKTRLLAITAKPWWKEKDIYRTHLTSNTQRSFDICCIENCN